MYVHSVTCFFDLFTAQCGREARRTRGDVGAIWGHDRGRAWSDSCVRWIHMSVKDEFVPRARFHRDGYSSRGRIRKSRTRTVRPLRCSGTVWCCLTGLFGLASFLFDVLRGWGARLKRLSVRTGRPKMSGIDELRACIFRPPPLFYLSFICGIPSMFCVCAPRRRRWRYWSHWMCRFTQIWPEHDDSESTMV